MQSHFFLFPLRGLCSPCEYEISKDEVRPKRKLNGGDSKREKHPKAKGKQQKKPTTHKKGIFVSLCSLLTYCTFLQDPEKSTWLYSSLFFSSLDTWMKPALVCGESRTCENERIITRCGLMPSAMQRGGAGMDLVASHKAVTPRSFFQAS